MLASAPGKIIWTGTYSVLEGGIAHVIAVDKRVTVKAAARSDMIVEISTPFGSALGLLQKDGRIRWRKKEEKLKFVFSACEAAVKFWKKKRKKLAGFSLSTENDAVFGGSEKSGLGSSAAVTVAVVAALLKFAGIRNRATIFELAYDAHSAAQGKVGSGFDVAAATYGTIAYRRGRKPYIEPLPVPKKIRLVLAFAGQSASTTEMVKKVMDFKRKNPAKYAQIIYRLERCNENAIHALKLLNKKWSYNALEEFRWNFEQGRGLLKILGEVSGTGIERPEHSKLIELAKKNGAIAAKLPGAGGGDSLLAVCVDDASKRRVESAWRRAGLGILDVQVSSRGVA